MSGAPLRGHEAYASSGADLGDLAVRDNINNGTGLFSSGSNGNNHKRVPCALLAEDDDEMRTLLARTLQRSGYRVIQCTDGLALMEHLAPFLPGLSRQRIDVIVADFRMPWVDGLEVLKCTRQHVGRPPFVLITAFPSEMLRAEAIGLGAAFVLSKPFEMEYFVDMVRTVVPPESHWQH
jgi:two-component system cell cycle response regulator CpdR